MKPGAIALAMTLTLPAVNAATLLYQSEHRHVMAQSADGAYRLTHWETSDPPPDTAGLSTLVETLAPLFPDRDTGKRLIAIPRLALEHNGKEVPLAGLAYADALSAKLSRDGSVMVIGAGANGSLDAWRWTRHGRKQRLLPETLARFSSVTALSADGKVVTGWYLPHGADAVPRGYLWRADTGFQALPAPLALPAGLSADGRTVFAATGTANRLGLLRQHRLVTLNGGNDATFYGEAFAISQDATRAAGYFHGGGESNYYRGWVWQAGQGYFNYAKAIHLSVDATNGSDAAWQNFRDDIIHLAGLNKLDTESSFVTGTALWSPGQPPRILASEGRPHWQAREADLAAWTEWDGQRRQVKLARGNEKQDADALGHAIAPVWNVTASANGETVLLNGESGSLVRRKERDIPLPKPLDSSNPTLSRSGRYLALPQAAGEANDVTWKDLDSDTTTSMGYCALLRGVRASVVLSDDAATLTVLGRESPGYCVFRTGIKEKS